MFFQFAFKKMEPSDSLMTMAIDKIESRIKTFSGHCINPHLTFSSNRGIQKIHFAMLTNDGFKIEVSHSGPDMYAEIDEVADRIEAQLRKHKERLREHKNHTGIRAATSGMSDAYLAPSWEDVLFEPKAIDAEDILKYESTRRQVLGQRQQRFEQRPVEAKI